MGSKAKPNLALYAQFFRALSQLQEIARNSDWLISLFAPVVIDYSNYFYDSHLKNAFSWKTELQSGPSQLIFLTKFRQQRGRPEKFSLDLQWNVVHQYVVLSTFRTAAAHGK